MSDNALGEFLRGRRDAVRPADVGLPGGQRRRAPGLRRSELATIAGISVEYLTRLEQGRDRHPSPQVLGALADALCLSPDERLHLRLLAKAADGALVMCQASHPGREVRPAVRALLERLEPTPAVVLNRLNDVVAATAGFHRLAGPLGLLDGEHPNPTRFLFTDPRARAAFPDWDAIADRHVAGLRIESSRADPAVTEFVGDLTVLGGPPFRERMRTHTDAHVRVGVERWLHPEVGELRLAFETLDVSGGDEQRLVAYLPADDATSAALDRLAGRHPGRLRSVTG